MFQQACLQALLLFFQILRVFPWSFANGYTRLKRMDATAKKGNNARGSERIWEILQHPLE